MKRFYLLFVNLLIVSGFIFTSCSNSDEEDGLLNSENSQSLQNEYVTMGYLNISPTPNTRSNQVQNYDVNFDNDNGESMLHFNLLELNNSHIYGCDMNGDETPDFYVKFISSKMDKFLYLDKNKNVLQECSLTQGSKNEFTIDVLHIYNFADNTSLTRSESWSDCFSRRMGSALGITMSVVAGFIGPEGTAAVAAAGALSCAIYDPF